MRSLPSPGSSSIRRAPLSSAPNRWHANDVPSQPFDPVESGETSVEGAEGKMTRFPGNLQHEAIRKAQGRPSAKAGDRSSHGFRILKRQMLMVEEHLHGGGDVLRTTVVNRRQNSRRFGEDEVRYPRPACDEGLGHRHLFRIIPRDQPDQDVRVNGPHGAS